MITYKEITGWMTSDSETFFNMMVDRLFSLNNPHIVEIGCFMGQSTCYISQKIKQKNINVRYDVIDHFLGSIEHQKTLEKRDLYKIFINNMIEADVMDTIRVFSVDSNRASLLYDNESLDFIFIDADHSYDAVKNDINVWFPKVKKGGILSGDDYLKCHPGVIKAVNEAFGNKTKFVKRNWYIEKL